MSESVEPLSEDARQALAQELLKHLSDDQLVRWVNEKGMATSRTKLAELFGTFERMGPRLEKLAAWALIGHAAVDQKRAAWKKSHPQWTTPPSESAFFPEGMDWETALAKVKESSPLEASTAASEDVRRRQVEAAFCQGLPTEQLHMFNAQGGLAGLLKRFKGLMTQVRGHLAEEQAILEQLIQDPPPGRRRPSGPR